MNLKQSTGPPPKGDGGGEGGLVSEARPPSPPDRTDADAPAERGPPAFRQGRLQASAALVSIMTLDACGEKRDGAAEETV